jgi:hypothetical protein
LGSAARLEIAKFWADRLLFGSTKSALFFLLLLQSKMTFFNLSKPIRHLPESLRKRWNDLSAMLSSQGSGKTSG